MGTRADMTRTQQPSNPGATGTPSCALGRRGILAAAGAALAGILARQASTPVAANTGDPMIIGGTNNANSATFVTAITPWNNTGAYAFLADASGAGTNTAGIVGQGNGNAAGIRGTGGSINGNGVEGNGAGTGTGVFGTSQTGAFGKGVYGKHLTNGFGVYGEATTTNGYGVQGTVTGGNAGARGVSGDSGTSGFGVYGTTTNGIGVFGTVSGGIGVQGISNGSFGVRGDSSSSHGVYGQSATGYGVLGYSTGGPASLSGISTNVNIPAFAGGNSQPGGLAAHFDGTVYVNGRLVVIDPSYKSGALAHPDGGHRLVYCVESPESWIEDVGSGTLSSGKATVTFDTDFAAVTRTDSYHVFLTSYDGANKGLAVTNRTAGGFTVQEQQGGTSNGGFSWKVMVKAKSAVKSDRLAKFALPQTKLPDPASFVKPQAVDAPKGSGH